MCLLTNVTGQNHLKHHLDHNRNQIQTLTIFEIILIFDSAEIRDKSELSANMHMSQNVIDIFAKICKCELAFKTIYVKAFIVALNHIMTLADQPHTPRPINIVYGSRI
jgi:hypothetical protein